ncbi:MAG: GGDEF domain-containing protein [Chloroflexi bacterium]|nr:GGDEF domain-containing protein [Chloroflexota bacterium]
MKTTPPAGPTSLMIQETQLHFKAGLQRDSILITVLSFLAFLLASMANTFEVITQVAIAHKDWHVAEVMTGFVIAILGFSLYASRRWLDLHRQMIESKRIEEQLRYLSTHDSLTGLYNRIYFEAELSRLQKGRQYPISVIMADVDHLKVVNDSFGHAAGDDLLQRTGKVLGLAFRAEDVVARIGGDEFAVLLAGTDADATNEALMRVRQNLAADNLQYNSTGRRLGLSLGAATAQRGEVLLETLKRADAQMYQDKPSRHITPAFG